MAGCEDVRLRNHPTKKSTASRSNRILDMETILAQDISDAVVQTMWCEIQQQERIGNENTHLTVNNRADITVQSRKAPSVVPRNAKKGFYAYRSQALFGRYKEMVDAAINALMLLKSLTRVRGGTARGSYRIFLGNTALNDSPGNPVGEDLAGIESLRSKIGPDSVINILGPWVIYGRKLYWNPAGGKKVTKRFPGTRDASRLGIRIKGGYKGTETIHTDVKKRMRRSAKWKAFSIGDPFFVPPGSPMVGDRRVPGISIKVKRRGRLN